MVGVRLDESAKKLVRSPVFWLGEDWKEEEEVCRLGLKVGADTIVDEDDDCDEDYEDEEDEEKEDDEDELPEEENVPPKLPKDEADNPGNIPSLIFIAELLILTPEPELIPELTPERTLELIEELETTVPELPEPVEVPELVEEPDLCLSVWGLLPIAAARLLF